MDNPNRAANSSVTQHFKADNSGKPILNAVSETAGVKSIRLEVATHIAQGLAACNGYNPGIASEAVTLAELLIQECQKLETKKENEDGESKEE